MRHKLIPNWPQLGPDWHKLAQVGPKLRMQMRMHMHMHMYIDPSWHQIGLSWHQIGAKLAQVGPKLATS